VAQNRELCKTSECPEITTGTSPVVNASSDGQHNRELTALQYSRHDTQSLLTMRVMPLFDVFEDDGSGAPIRNLTPLSVRRSGPPPSSIVTPSW
jgi:hypothetical protein